MRLTSLRLTGAVVPALFVLSHATACHDDHEEGPSAGVADVVFESGATDEALEEMLGLTAKAGDKKARLSSPANGAKVDGVPSFDWTYTAATGHLRVPPTRSPSRGAAPWKPFGLQSAHAHGTPMNGTGYLLVLSTTDNPKLMRAFTSATTFKPSAAVWDRVKKDAKGQVRAVVTTALFENNRVLASGGPFEGEAITFEIQQ